MSITMQEFLNTPVHPGVRDVALMAYRVAEEKPDDGAGLTRDQRLKAILDVYCAVHVALKGETSVAAAEAERLWDTALSAQQKRMIAASPGAAPMIVADAVKQDAALAQKAALRTPRSEAEIAAEAAHHDARGLTALQKLGLGGGIVFRKDYGSMSSQWDPNTGGLGLTPANFPTTPFSRAGLDLATTQHLFGLGFGTGNILAAAKSADFLGIGKLNKKGMQHLAAVDKHDPEKEKTLTLAKAYTDALGRDEEYQALRRRYLAGSGAERKALDEQMRKIEERHARATGYQRHIEAAPAGKIRDARVGVQESINEVNRSDEDRRRAYGIISGPAAAERNPYAAPGRAPPRAAEKIIEDYWGDKNSPVARRAYQELKAAMRSPEQRAALDKLEKEFAQRDKAQARLARENAQKATGNEQRTARNEQTAARNEETRQEGERQAAENSAAAARGAELLKRRLAQAQAPRDNEDAPKGAESPRPQAPSDNSRFAGRPPTPGPSG